MKTITHSATATAAPLAAMPVMAMPVAVPVVLPRETPRARVVRWVTEGIERGELVPERPLPTERAVARATGVSAGTVNTAFNELQSQGVLRLGGGRLRYVSRLESGARAARPTFVLFGHPRGSATQRAAGWRWWIDQGILDGACAARTHCLVHFLDDLESEWEHLLEARVAGVCVDELIRQEWPLLRRLASTRGGPPLAVFGNEVGMADFDHVRVDHELGGYLVTRHLIEAGRQRIALMGSVNATHCYWFGERRAGYERALREAGLPVLPTIVPSVAQLNEVAERAEFEEQARFVAGHLCEPLLCQSVDALVALSDRNVPALVRACRLLRREPGDKVWIAGFDNYWQDCREREFEPLAPCVSLDKNYYQCGQELFALLRARVRDELPAAPQCIVVRPQLAFPNA